MGEKQLEEKAQRRPDTEVDAAMPESSADQETPHESMAARVHDWTAVSRRVRRR